MSIGKQLKVNFGGELRNAVECVQTVEVKSHIHGKDGEIFVVRNISNTIIQVVKLDNGEKPCFGRGGEAFVVMSNSNARIQVMKN